MKQRIRVVGTIKSDEGVLVLKRSQGRSEAPVFWELLTGKIKFGEQPEEAMARTLTEYAGLVAESVKLKDVVTFLAPEGSSQLSNLYIVYEIKVTGSDSGIRPEPKERYTAFKFVKDFAAANLRVNEASATVLSIINEKVGDMATPIRDTVNAFTIQVDGASRGNPGPAGIGYCIYDSSGRIVEQGHEFIGFATSRVAEYLAMRKGIGRAIELGYKTARFISDSLMVVNQLSGVFAVKNQDIRPIYEDILEKLAGFEAVSFSHVPRSKNVIADAEANRAIDETLKKS